MRTRTCTTPTRITSNPLPHPMITPQDINVLIACEESQVECKAFRALGCNAFSCDIQPCAGGHPEWHIQSDVTPYLDGTTVFKTCDGKWHRVGHWHLIVAHPPCTYLCRVSSVQLVHNGVVDHVRYERLLKAREFFFHCLAAQADYVAVENPIPMARARLPRPSFYTNPNEFGHKYTKKTLWWVHDLSPVLPTIEHPNPKCFAHCSRGKYRSRTFPNVAEACARTWLADIITDYNILP